MVEWKLARLDELADIKHGFAFQGKFFSTDGPGDILMTPGNFVIGGGFQWGKRKYYAGPVPAEYVLRPGDLIVTMTDLSKEADTLGYAAIVPDCKERLLHNQRIGKVVKRSDNVALRFLHWVMRSRDYRDEVLASVTGSTVKHTSPKKILAFRFLLPPLSEQEAIASVLDALDDKIDLNRRMNETLEAMAGAIFKDWFLDFGPTRAKMKAKPPYMPPEIWSLFPDGLDGEGKPKGWLTTRWGELISLEYGKSLTGYDGANEPYPVFGTNGQIGFHSKPLCPHPGIIIGRKGAYRGVHYCDQPFFVIDTAFYIEPRERAVELRWAYYEMLRLGINNMDSGSAIPSTSRADFYSLPVLYPQFDVQQAFVRLLSPFWERQKQCDQECKTLAALRDALLPKLMTGEIRHRDAEKMVEAAA